MISIGGRPFIPFKCAPAYLGYSMTWLKMHDYRNGGPKRTWLGPGKTGYWKTDADAWLRRRKRIKRAA